MTEIKLDNKQKVDILLKALDERYQSIRVIRERIQNICIWTLGLLVTVAGWLIQSDMLFIDLNQKVIYTIFIVLTFALIRFYYLLDLHKGFKNQLKVATHIEGALKLYEVSEFDSLKSSIYPKEWKNENNGKFFNTNVRLIDLGTFILLVSLWLKDCFLLF